MAGVVCVELPPLLAPPCCAELVRRVEPLYSELRRCRVARVAVVQR